MDILQVLVLGLIEGVTEFLPISSTGHLMLAAKLLNLSQSEFAKSFEISIQLGAIISVVVLYWRKLANGIDIWKKLFVAFIPAGVIGAFLYKLIKEYLLGNNGIVLWSLFLGGIFLIVFELLHREKATDLDELSAISYPQALCIGFFQCFAMIPGVSRSAATIIGGLLAGLKRKTIVEFSFLLAIPTMLAAVSLDLYKSAHVFTRGDFFSLGLGFVVSFLVAAVTIKFLLAFIKRHSFISFGVYRIFIALVFWLIIR